VPDYRIDVTAQLSPWSSVDAARMRLLTGATVTELAHDVVRVELRCDGIDAICAADRALIRITNALSVNVRFTRPAVWIARRRGPLGVRRRTTGRWHPGNDDDGLAGVREPRRPAPTAGSAAAALDPDAA
jgi:hypothetical protein